MLTCEARSDLGDEEQRSSMPVESGRGLQLDGFAQIGQGLADAPQRRQDLFKAESRPDMG